jgi:peptidoglycan hydrolase-like protein with peptidoglycan-binding domain
MLPFRASLAFVLFTALTVSPVFSASTRHHHSASSHAATHSSRAATHSSDATAHGNNAPAHSSRATTHGGRRAKATKTRSHGQQAIDSDRVTEIQEALIREHYLTGDATGKWDDTTKAAMQKFQADQGWQTKLMPDSRALKKLGLGPDYSNAINAKSSSFAPPPPASTIPPVASAGFAEAAGVTP